MDNLRMPQNTQIAKATSDNMQYITCTLRPVLLIIDINVSRPGASSRMRPTRLDPAYKYRASPGGLDKGGSNGGVSEDKLGRMPTAAAAAAELYSNSTLFVPATLYTHC